MFIQIKSSNPDFSFVMQKNPASGMMVRPIREGHAFGWYSANGKAFNIYFNDATDEVSFKDNPDQDFEYVDKSRFSHPLALINCFSEFVQHLNRGEHAKDTSGEYHNEILINMMETSGDRLIEAFKNNFTDYNIEAELVAGRNYYRLKFESKSSLKELIGLVLLFSIITAITNDREYFIEEGAIDKYMTILSHLDAPYYVRYLSKVKMLKNERLFGNYRELLNTSARYHIRMKYGDTGHQRRSYIMDALDGKRPVADIGCGEMRNYGFSLAKRIGTLPYYAIDSSEEEIFKVNRRVAHKAIENVFTFNSLDSFLIDYNGEEIDVVLSEVIEHMEKEEAENLILSVLESVNFRNFIITTPNKDFNIHYHFLEGQMRHPDHKFEISALEFRSWMDSIKTKHTIACDHYFSAVGDLVDTITPSLGLLITKHA